MYAQRGHGKRSSFYSDFTFGCWRAANSEDAEGKRELAPVGKAYIGFTDAELRWLDEFGRDNTPNQFGPVREVTQAWCWKWLSRHPASSRHKSGVAMRFPQDRPHPDRQAGRRSRYRRRPPAALAVTGPQHHYPLDMIDPFGRPISYLRVSVTDRCDFRCVYCMSEDMTFLPKRTSSPSRSWTGSARPSSAGASRSCASPAASRWCAANVMRLMSESLGAAASDSGGLQELTLTTNGTQLRQVRQNPRPRGVRRSTSRIDTLTPPSSPNDPLGRPRQDPARPLRRQGGRAGTIKINAVAMNGVNDMEFDELIQFSHGRGMDLVLIEVMPMGEIGVAG